MEELFADFVVIGSGPAGQKGAVQAAKLGKSVVLVEREEHLGGASLNSGTIPSKSLKEAILDLTEFYQKSFYAKTDAVKEVSINDLNFRLHMILDSQRGHLRKQCEKNDIRIVHGTAQFEEKNRLLVLDSEKKVLFRIRFDYALISTGSKPRNPKNVPFDSEKVLDSTRLLSIDHVPKTLTVLGGGIVGAEYASYFAALGTKVTVVDKRSHLLPLLDNEIGLHLQKSLGEIGLKVVGNSKFDEVKKTEEGVALHLQSGEKIESEMLLYALGRMANVEGLGIEKVGITVDSKGFIPVNPLFQTVVPHIYAAGDVIGPPALAATSFEQGRLAARHAFGAQTHYFSHFYPIGIYTIPEISSCGYTEEQLKELGFHYEVGRAYYYEIARNQLAGMDSGLFKILFHAETLEILGIHIIGRGATENIHIGQVAMTFNARIDYFIDQVFNYPTYAEGYRIAALNGFNKIKHKR